MVGRERAALLLFDKPMSLIRCISIQPAQAEKNNWWICWACLRMCREDIPESRLFCFCLAMGLSVPSLGNTVYIFKKVGLWMILTLFLCFLQERKAFVFIYLFSQSVIYSFPSFSLLGYRKVVRKFTLTEFKGK